MRKNKQTKTKPSNDSKQETTDKKTSETDQIDKNRHEDTDKRQR